MGLDFELKSHFQAMAFELKRRFFYFKYDRFFFSFCVFGMKT